MLPERQFQIRLRQLPPPGACLPRYILWHVFSGSAIGVWGPFVTFGERGVKNRKDTNGWVSFTPKNGKGGKKRFSDGEEEAKHSQLFYYGQLKF